MDKLEELTKISIDPFEFLKYVKIQEPGELALTYEMWSHLVEFYRALLKQKLTTLVKSKQIGISWALAIYALWKIYTIPGWNVLELSKGKEEAQALLLKSKVVYHNLPDWLKVFTLEPNSTEKFGFKEMSSKITAFPSTETAGIGETAGLVIHDEAEFHDYFELNLGHTLATVADKVDRQLVVVTTVDKTKPDSFFKGLHKGAKGSGYSEAGTNNFEAMFFPYNVRPNRDRVWYEQEKLVHIDKPGEMEANYPITVEEALSPLSAQSCFKKEKLDKLWEEAINPETRQGFIYILRPPAVGTQYVGGVDVGEGVELDYSVLTIVGKQGLQAEVAAVIYSNQVGTAEFAYDVSELSKEYYKPLLNIDNIGIGRAVIDKLHELGYTNLYYADEKREKAGWSLTRPNKRELVVKLVESINDGSLITRFKPQIKELMEYQWVNGYPEPTGKTHGDTVISLMLANQMLKKVGTKGEIHMTIRGERIF